ncbi:AcrVA2 family anti-CRISPR protein [Nitrospira sp. Kam-Ns4a]
MGTGDSHRAQAIFRVVSQAYPDAWQALDRLREQRGRGLPGWPDWCYVPLHGAAAIVSRGEDAIPFDRAHHIAIIGALGAWRMTRGIYRFDPTLYADLITTELESELPRSLLYRLPEWCVYLETPGLCWTLGREQRPIHGVWLHLDWDLAPASGPGSVDELRLLLDTAPEPERALDPRDGLLSIPLLLGEGTIADALLRFVRSAQVRARERGIEAPDDLFDPNHLARAVSPILSLILYLCADDPDIAGRAGRPGNPEPVRTRRQGVRLFPASGLRMWDVGVRLGAALRRAMEEAGAEGDAGGTAGERARPRGHIRRAHWHTYRVGTGRRDVRLKWLPPIPVNLAWGEELPATIRPVRAEQLSDGGADERGGSCQGEAEWS